MVSTHHYHLNYLYPPHFGRQYDTRRDYPRPQARPSYMHDHDAGDVSTRTRLPFCDDIVVTKWGGRCEDHHQTM